MLKNPMVYMFFIFYAILSLRKNPEITGIIFCIEYSFCKGEKQIKKQ